MVFNTLVEKDESTLKFLLQKAEEYKEERLLYSISIRRFTVIEIEMMTADIKESLARMSKEHISLLNFAAFFNKHYATNNNRCFDTAYYLFNRMNSTIACTKKIYKKTCRRINKKYIQKNGEELSPSVFTASLLNESADLFGIDTYPKAVEELCIAMRDFYKMLITIIKLCRKVINRERQIRNDPQLCLIIYKNSCDQALKDIKNAIDIFPTQKTSMIPLDDFTKKKQNTSPASLQKFICDGLHTLNIKQLRAHSYCEALSAGNKEGLNEIESKIFNKDRNTGKWIHAIIEHFDEITPKGRLDTSTNKHKISTKHVAILMLMFNTDRFCNKKTFIEDYFFTQYKGDYIKANYASIEGQFKKITKKQKEYIDFETAIQQFKPCDNNSILNENYPIGLTQGLA